MKWTRISPFGDRQCATANCDRSASWHGEAGEVGSDYCAGCRDAVDAWNLREAALRVLKFDWSDNDADAVAAINDLRRAVAES